MLIAFPNSPALRCRNSPKAGRRTGSRHNARVKAFSPETDMPPSPLPIAAPNDEDARLQSLISAMANAQADAMAQLYDQTIARVYSLVRRFCADDASAQDVTQEVYWQAWQQASRFDAERGAAMAWLLNLARSRALDAWRKQSTSRVVADSELADQASAYWSHDEQPQDFLEAADAKAQIHAAMASLPAATRQMLSLAFFHDMTHTEISAHLHMPLGTVKSTLRRCLLNLRDHLNPADLTPQHRAALAENDTL
jgi:RNA polymerase sigma factor (sigma-70 family)